jgi:hypothetical protein
MTGSRGAIPLVLAAPRADMAKRLLVLTSLGGIGAIPRTVGIGD